MKRQVLSYEGSEMTAVNYPGTLQQEGIWFHSLANGSLHWNLINIRHYRGEVNTDRLKRALSKVIEKHSALRTNFFLDGNQLIQKVASIANMDQVFEYCILGHSFQGTIADWVDDELLKFKNYEFNLEKESLIKFRVLQAGELFFFIVCIHHIISDATSMQIFWKDLSIFFNEDVNTIAAAERPVVKQYSTFAVEQQALFKQESYQKQRIFWADKLSLEIPGLNLSFSHSHKKTDFIYIEVALPDGLAENIRSYSLRNRLINSSVYYGAYLLLLFKYSKQETIAVGNIINGRGFKGYSNRDVVGLFANRLINVFRINVHDDSRSFLRYVNQEVLDSFLNSDMPFEEAMRAYNHRHKKGLSSLFRAAFNVIKQIDQRDDFNGLSTVEPLKEPAKGLLYIDHSYDSYLYILDSIKDVTVRLELKCDTDLQDIPDLLADNYIQILKDCIDPGNKSIAAILSVSDHDRKQLYEFNQTESVSPAPLLIHMRFSRQAKCSPDQIAVKCGAVTLTYQELASKSDQIALQLIASGVKAGDLLAILMNRTCNMMLALLSVLKSGAAYLPLDPAYSPSRLKFMVDDSHAQLVITEIALVREAEIFDHILMIESLAEEPGPVLSQELPLQPELAYVIYTSGSTGRPKGVMITHDAVVNFIDGICEGIDFHHKTIYSLTTLSFDIFVLESLLPLCVGGTVIIGTEEEQRNPEKAIEVMIREKVSVFQCTPSRMKIFLERGGTSFLEQLTDLLIGGEAFPDDLYEKLKVSYGGNLYNMYGPTETTIWSTYKILSGGTALTAGKPIRNTKIYILDEHHGLEGIGIYGEICISGSGLSPGYIGREDLTAEQFIFIHELPGERLYKTGDIGRWLPGGELEVAGRNDNQVKIRGYRIEPGEIEFHMRNISAVTDAAVVIRDHQSEKVLCAFYTASSVIEDKEMRQILRRQIPDFMIPSHFILLADFPLNHNKKTDLSALKEININYDRKDNQQTSSLDHQLVAIWQAKLMTGENEDDNFFELGGDSLAAIGLVSAVETAFELKIKLKDFFQYPTLKFLNEAVTSNKNNHH